MTIRLARTLEPPLISQCYRRGLRVAMRTAARMKSRASASCRPETVVDVAQLTAVYESRSRGSGIARSNVTGKKGSQMPINSKYLFVASMDVDPDKEALFNEIYDAEHVPNLLKVPGVHAATRIKGEPFALEIGGSTKTIIHEGARYSTVYENRWSARPCQSRMGEGGGGRSPAKPSASIYSQSNARLVQGPLASASSATAGGTSASRFV